MYVTMYGGGRRERERERVYFYFFYRVLTYDVCS